MAERESDRRVVPAKPGNSGGGKTATPSRSEERAPSERSSGPSALTRLTYITERAQKHTEEVFTNLYHLLNYELLWYAFRKLKRNKAPGVDGVTIEDYEANLRGNLRDLADRLKRQAYRPQPSLRRSIPKGKNKTRPLGIACVEDKIVQRAIVMILERIYEVDFSDDSFGFRPDRSCHDALSALDRIISRRRVNWISDSDIRGYFDQSS